MTVRVVSDSAAALPDDIARELDVTVVPMWFTLDGASVAADSVDLDEMFTHDQISTSGPAPGEFAAAIRDHGDGDGVCVLTISATMSSTIDGKSPSAVKPSACGRVCSFQRSW